MPRRVSQAPARKRPKPAASARKASKWPAPSEITAANNNGVGRTHNMAPAKSGGGGDSVGERSGAWTTARSTVWGIFIRGATARTLSNMDRTRGDSSSWRKSGGGLGGLVTAWSWVDQKVNRA